MNKTTATLRLFSASLLLALVFSATLTMVASADEGTPPPEPAATEEPASADDLGGDEAAPTQDTVTDEGSAATVEDQPVAGDEIVSGEEAPVLEARLDTTTDTPLVPETLFSQIPDDTQFVVLNENGEIVPLATTEAADILAIADPRWCPVGVTPPASPLASGGCSAAFPSLSALVAGFFPSAAGVIWIQSGVDTGADATINGAGTWAAAANFLLTLKGGWSGLNNTVTNAATPSIFDTHISIINWNADVTLNDIEFSGVVGGSQALNITTSKNIVLNRVHVHNSTGGAKGAVLNNTISSGTGNVTINSSEFTLNSSDNLTVNSNGTITLSNVIASGSTGGSGALLNNSGVAGKSVTVTGTNAFDSISLPITGYAPNDFFNSFNNNAGGMGLSIASKGTITLSNLTASDNGSRGAYLLNDFALISAGMTLTGTNYFNDNGDTGLLIQSRGPVAASNLTANSNAGSGSGVWIENYNAITAQPVTLSGSNEFKYNSKAGLYIRSNGQITLNNVLAYKNAGTASTEAGVYLDNNEGLYSSGVTLTGTNEITNNNNHGLYILSNGAVSLANITSNYNGNLSGTGFAVYINNQTAFTPKNVTISGTNVIDSNLRGLYVYSKGAITANNLTVTNNSGPGGYNGALLQNDHPGALGGGVTLTGTNKFTGSSSGAGLMIISYGAISVSNVTAFSNGTSVIYASGIFLDNHLSPSASPGITISGVNVSNSNGVHGVVILTKGAVSVSSLTANYNGYANTSGNGLYIDNSYGTGTVTVSGTNGFSSDYSGGLVVFSKGAITLSNVTASYNNAVGGDNGADLSNLASGPGSPQNVTISGTNNFNSNSGNGLRIQTYGTISLNNVTALYSSGANGAVLINSTGSLAKNVTLIGSNTFNYNNMDGLDITSLGLVSINNLQAYYNATGFGALIDNTLGTMGVTLSGTNNINNHSQQTGLKIQSRGAITISNLTAGSNGNGVGEYGAWLDNSTAVSAKSVTLSGNNSTQYNYDSGLFIKSIGLISVNNLAASNNGTGGSSHGYGLEISNATDTAGVTQTGYLQASSNYSGGLFITSKGPITLINVTANDNNGAAGALGAEISNLASSSGSPQNVTLNGVNTFYSNDGTGLVIDSYGAISLSKVTATSSFTGSGAELDNSTGSMARNVTITGVAAIFNTFDSNQLNGLVVNSLGLISVSYVEASYNVTGMGASLHNNLGTAGVTLTGTNFFLSNAADTGLDILSRGAINISNLYANSNGDAIDEFGASLVNSSAPSPQAVTLSGTNHFTYNEDSGLYIKSIGFVTLNQVTASYNGTAVTLGYGLEITNLANNTGVTITGTNYFENNYVGGLWVTSKGPISMSNVNADNSAGPVAIGAKLDNTASLATTPQNVTLSGNNNFTYNPGGGLVIDTFGAITLNHVNASYSTSGYGADLNNSAGSLFPRNVTFTSTNTFYTNAFGGLYVQSSGGITTAGLTANSNSAFGASLSAVGNVTFSSASEFTSNSTQYGLAVTTSGAISISNLTAYGNGNSTGDTGASLVNLGGIAQPITLTGTNSFIYNYGSGLVVYSKGAVNLSNLTVQYNDQAGTLIYYGADIDNASAVSPQNVTISGTNVFTGNLDQGLHVNSLGIISLNNVTAASNSKLGVLLNNNTDGKGVSLTGTNLFTNNGYGGLVVYSRGIITLNNVNATGNSNVAAVQLDNSASTSVALQGVTLIGTNTVSSNFAGLDIKSKGNITINSLTAWDNYSGTGAKLNNSFGTGAVTLTGTNKFLDNAAKGLEIISTGAVTLANVRADDNASSGVDITTTGNVTFSCGSMSGNGIYGLKIANAAVVTLKAVVTAGNSTADENFSGLGTLVRVRTCP